MTQPIRVVAAVRRRGRRLWICRRTDNGSHGGLAGMWEYPGGKAEDGEALELALRREMQEEFGVEIEIWKLITTIETPAYGNVYAVTFFDVTFLSEPELRVHDACEWVEIENLDQFEHLPSGTEFNLRLAAGEYEPGWIARHV